MYWDYGISYSPGNRGMCMFDKGWQLNNRGGDMKEKWAKEELEEHIGYVIGFLAGAILMWAVWSYAINNAIISKTYTHGGEEYSIVQIRQHIRP